MRKPISKKKVFILAGILVVALAAGFFAFRMLAKKNENGTAPTPSRKEVLVFFYPGTDGLLKKKSIEIGGDTLDKVRADMILAELKREKAVPDTVALRDIVTDTEGIMYLNLSHDIKNEEMGTVEEITIVYSIVNSFLSNFKSAKKIQLLIEGQVFHTLNGLLYTYNPLEFNTNLVEE